VRTQSARLAIDGGTPVRTSRLPYGKGVALIDEEERDAVLEVLKSRSLFRYYGPNLLAKVAAFEAAVCDSLGAKHAVATSSGTAALRTALAALGVGCGDEVIVPAFTFIATVNAVVLSGAVPVFAEIDESLGLDAASFESNVSERTAAVIPVHLENVGCDMASILDVAGQRQIPVIEDTAQAMGATYQGGKLGTLGDLGAFSLQLDKNVTSGEGGVVVTNDDDLYLRAARYQDQGGQFVTSHGGTRGAELDESFVGENLRMTEMAGAIAEVQLRKLPRLLEAMRRNKSAIIEAIGEVPGMDRRRIPDPEGDGSSSITWFLRSAGVATRFVESLVAEGVPSAQIYDGKPVYAAPSILEKRTASGKGGPWNCSEHPTRIEYRMGMCPRTEGLVSRSMTVGVGAAYSEGDCNDVAEAVQKVARHLLA
jgi:8-amino-3,8-dideoxy-alpha-D-manno-octulosonate transaminase